jgi:hypothetical protein
MALTTYGYISEQILTTYYKGIRNDDSQYSLKHIASMVAQEVAFMARKNAFENGNNGDVTYINDQFITTYQSVPVATDNVSGYKYCVLPAVPTALPKNQEIVSVSLNTKTNKTFLYFVFSLMYLAKNIEVLPPEVITTYNFSFSILKRF